MGTDRLWEHSPLADRRQGDRRQGSADGARAPHGIDRRRGERRRPVVTTLAGLAMVSGLAIPLDAQVSRGTSVFTSANWFVDPASNARKQADLWRSTRPADAAQMDKIAAGSTADWFGDWSGDVMAAVDKRVTQIVAASALPILVAYNIPNRDCSGYSSGGAPSAAAYRDWIRRFALGVGNRRAAVVLEPDALGHLSQCGTAAQQQERLDLLWDAVQVLKQSGIAVYIDAGHSHWMSVDTAVSRLRSAAVMEADGFSLNVSNFYNTAEQVAYGRAISRKLAGKHFIVDTSRNGLGANGTWCNPDGRALGDRPTASTGDTTIDAFVWIKRPGQSDGQCNGGPAAGTWWPDYALGLAQRASY